MRREEKASNSHFRMWLRIYHEMQERFLGAAGNINLAINLTSVSTTVGFQPRSLHSVGWQWEEKWIFGPKAQV